MGCPTRRLRRLSWPSGERARAKADRAPPLARRAGRWDESAFLGRFHERLQASGRGLAFAHFALHLFDNLKAIVALKVFFHAAEGDADDVAMVKVGTQAQTLREFEPDVVDAVDVFGPEARRMGAEVDEFRGPVRLDDFEGEGVFGVG